MSTTPTTPMPIAMSRLMTGSFGERGGCFMMSRSPFSSPSASAGAPSLTRFSHRSCTGRSGIGMPEEHRPEHDQDLADVAGQQEVHELADVRVDDPPLLDGGDDAREIVVGEHHVGRLLRHVRAGDAHRNADVGPLEGGRVVDAVAGHRHDVVARLEGLDDARLVLRRHAAAHVEPVGPRRELLVGEPIDLRAGQHEPARRAAGRCRARWPRPCPCSRR